MYGEYMSVHLERYAIPLRSVPVARPIQNIVMVIKIATRPNIASFDQAFLAADVTLVSEECGSAVA